MNNMITSYAAYASARIDGVLDFDAVRFGILDTPGQPTPVVNFFVVAGPQRHPVWALDRLAAVVYCYCKAVGEPDGKNGHIELNLTGNLVSGMDTSCVVASSINWHTSAEIRRRAEGLIEDMSGWPFQESLQIPVKKPA